MKVVCSRFLTLEVQPLIRVPTPLEKPGIPYILEFFVQGLGFLEKRRFFYRNLEKCWNFESAAYYNVFYGLLGF